MTSPGPGVPRTQMQSVATLLYPVYVMGVVLLAIYASVVGVRPSPNTWERGRPARPVPCPPAPGNNRPATSLAKG